MVGATKARGAQEEITKVPAALAALPINQAVP